MPTLISEITLGITSSFMGTLPMSMLNMSILQLSLDGKYRAAIAFLMGAALIEFCQIMLTLLGMQWLLTIPHLTAILTCVSIPVLLIMGIKTWKTPAKIKNIDNLLLNIHVSKTDIINQNFPYFRNGFILSAMNVMTYPFWLLWGNVFVQNGWLTPQYSDIIAFSVGACIGTVGAFGSFIMLGKLIHPYLNTVQLRFNQVLGAMFVGFACVQLYKLVDFKF
jgi:threonine/homoserine/homoserine lactone efflux protein